MHFVQVALCGAPLLHRKLRLQQRCEIALSGFLIVDLFRLDSEERCAALKLPRGSLSMAPQTCQNLQSAALSAVVVCLAKDAQFQPFETGFGRLSELSVEQRFSMLRRQSMNSQLSCRSYWQASARHSMVQQRKMAKEIPSTATAPALTEAELPDAICWHR